MSIKILDVTYDRDTGNRWRPSDRTGFRGPVSITTSAMLDEIERLQSALQRIEHFAAGDCDLPNHLRLRCILKEIEAQKAREA